MICVSLDKSPSQRWEGLEPYRDQAKALVNGACGELSEYVPDIASGVLGRSAWFRGECKSVAQVIDEPVSKVMTANLYYDLLKFVFMFPFGCTAVAYRNKEGNVVHARNLDWPDFPGDLLGTSGVEVSYQRRGKEVFRTVSWPGFVGVLSGYAPGRFSITLNATLSEEKPCVFGLPPTLLIRQVLERSPSFNHAMARLSQARMTSDCLLMLAGEKTATVIERTPTKFAHRSLFDEPLVVTNDYVELEHTRDQSGVIAETSCNRYKAASKKAKEASCSSHGFKVLDSAKMDITVQQMIFSVGEGVCEVR